MVYTHAVENFSEDIQHQIDTSLSLLQDRGTVLVDQLKEGETVVVGALGEEPEYFYTVTKLEDDWYKCIPYYELDNNQYTRGFEEVKSIEFRVHVNRSVLHAALENPNFTFAENLNPTQIRVRDVLNFAQADAHLLAYSDFTKQHFTLELKKY